MWNLLLFPEVSDSGFDLQSKYRRAVSEEDSEPDNDRVPYNNAHARSKQVGSITSS